jgi:hypothetical protein
MTSQSPLVLCLFRVWSSSNILSYENLEKKIWPRNSYGQILFLSISLIMIHSKDDPARSKEDLACKRKHSKDDPARSKEDLACKRMRSKEDLAGKRMLSKDDLARSFLFQL